MTRQIGRQRYLAPRRILVVLSCLGFCLPASVAAQSPGERIAVISGSNRSGDLHVMNNEGGSRKWLATAAPGDRPAWSPDGGRIAFARLMGDQPKLHIIGVDRSNERVIGAEWAAHPAWSPDGNKIAFVSGGSTPRSETFGIFVTNADGTGTRRLTSPDLSAMYPSWSPDGTRIAFSGGSQASVNWATYVMNADGSSQRLVKGSSMSHHTQQAWSPDGTRIAYLVVPGSQSSGVLEPVPSDAPGSIRVMKADGSDDTEVVAVGEESSVWHPSWSPDGTRILFTFYIFERQANGGAEHVYRIQTIRPDGTERSTVTQGLPAAIASFGGARAIPASAAEPPPKPRQQSTPAVANAPGGPAPNEPEPEAAEPPVVTSPAGTTTTQAPPATSPSGLGLKLIALFSCLVSGGALMAFFLQRTKVT